MNKILILEVVVNFSPGCLWWQHPCLCFLSILEFNPCQSSCHQNCTHPLQEPFARYERFNLSLRFIVSFSAGCVEIYHIYSYCDLTEAFSCHARKPQLVRHILFVLWGSCFWITIGHVDTSWDQRCSYCPYKLYVCEKHVKKLSCLPWNIHRYNIFYIYSITVSIKKRIIRNPQLNQALNFISVPKMKSAIWKKFCIS